MRRIFGILSLTSSLLYGANTLDASTESFLGEKSIQFLYGQYAHKQDVMDKAQQILPPVYDALQCELSEDLRPGENPKKVFLKLLETTLTFTIFDERMYLPR